jgi:hypothetical protein
VDTQPKQLIGSVIRDWIQIVVILFATAFGVYQFVFKEMWSPKAAPINVTLDLQARKAGETRNPVPKRQLIALEIKVTAKNPSSRTVYLLTNFWVAHASNITTRSDMDDESINKEVVQALNSGDGNLQMERHSELENTTIVASGTLFKDKYLRPGEAITRTIIFYIPRGRYEHVQVSAHIPTAAIEGIELEWEYDPEKLTFSPKLYRKDATDKPQEIPAGKGGIYEDKELEYQAAESSADISLWP